ncbi:MAG: hypothetical protein N4A49_11645 [Marinifilaceae bacterium]|jgi:hypothetical protein|nr:hypothetical protein [Marinifilaceae bacterium]
MRKLILIVIILASYISSAQKQVDSKIDITPEKRSLENIRKNIKYNSTLKDVIEKLSPILNDSIDKSKISVYKFLYEYSLKNDNAKYKITEFISDGLFSESQAVVSCCINLLKRYKLDDYSEQAKKNINLGLKIENNKNLDEIILLAGFIGTGKNTIINLINSNKLNTKEYNSAKLALCRMGDKSALNYSLKLVDRYNNQNKKVKLIEGLIYTKNRHIYNRYFSQIKKHKNSLNEMNNKNIDKLNEFVDIITKLSKQIIDFPIKYDNYYKKDSNEKILDFVEVWINKNPLYRINCKIY